jgi:putative oxidoreductase
MVDGSSCRKNGYNPVFAIRGCQLGSPHRPNIAVRERTATMMDILFHGVGWTDIALTLNRIAVGMFFMLSGYHKLFNPQRHRELVDQLKELGVHAVGFNQWWVPTVEFSAGCAVVIGLLAPLAALGLLVLILVAIATSGPQRIKAYKPIDEADRIDDWLYLPETLYAVMLIMVVSAGAGPYSLDALVSGLIDKHGA